LRKILEEWFVKAAGRQVDFGELHALTAVGLYPVQDLEGSQDQRVERIAVHSDFERCGCHRHLRGREYQKELIPQLGSLSKK
jgi:hypothetical protein